MLLTLGLYLLWNVNCVYLILIGAVCGILISEYYERRGGDRA
jgi:chromate transporter